MTKRKITNKDRKVFRKNALMGTAETKGRKQRKSKYGQYSWGFRHTPKGTKPRKHQKGKVLVHMFRAGKRTFTLLLKKDAARKGKQPYTATFLEDGKTQSTLDNRIKVQAESFPDARKKAVKEFRGKGK